MNDTVTLLGIGVILGALLSSGVWLVLLVIRKAERQVAREKNLVMKAIAEDSAEADKVLSSVVSKSMNAHALRSALSPKIDRMQKTLTENMHVLDIYFVKYMETRAAAYRAAFEGGDSPSAPLAVDKYLSDAKQKQPDTSASIAEEIRARIESLAPASGVAKEAAPQEPVAGRSDSAASPAFEALPPKTVPVAPVRSPAGSPINSPAIDLRTGIITVSEDVREDHAKRDMAPPKPQPASPAPGKPTKADKEKPRPRAVVKEPPEEPPKASAVEDDAFDLEKEFGAVIDSKLQKEIIRPANAAPHGIDHGEKTLQWDRSQLEGAAGPGESIVVEGAEVANKPSAVSAKDHSPVPEKDEEPIISGEDIENTMDSFFGLNDK